VSSFLTAHQHILGNSVPENGVKNVIMSIFDKTNDLLVVDAFKYTGK